MKSYLEPAGYALAVILCLPLSVEAHRAVLHPECMIADALATALTVLGAEAGFAYARRRGVAALFIERGPRGIEERMTPSFAAMLE